MSDAAAMASTPSHVHVAILRTVRAGRERDFEEKVAGFFGAAARQPGVCGAYLIRPVAGSNSREYGILRTFENESDMRGFYASDAYSRWQDEIRPLVEGEPQRRELHGLEAFFRAGASPPPQWKMALITWLGVNPAVYICSHAVPAVFGHLPALAGLLVVNAFVVTLLTWAFMPVLIRIFRPWLQPRG